MTLSLNHVSIRTTNLAATQHFYVDVLGLAVGPRPEFPFPGLWLYQGPLGEYAHAAIHVIGLDPKDPTGLQQYLGDRAPGSLVGSGAVDHVAFFATGLQQMLERLERLSVPARQRTVPGVGLHQLFLDDPNGIVVELNYPLNEAQALGAATAS